jgi:hypothetical protein
MHPPERRIPRTATLALPKTSLSFNECTLVIVKGINGDRVPVILRLIQQQKVGRFIPFRLNVIVDSGCPPWLLGVSGVDDKVDIRNVVCLCVLTSRVPAYPRVYLASRVPAGLVDLSYVPQGHYHLSRSCSSRRLLLSLSSSSMLVVTAQQTTALHVIDFSYSTSTGGMKGDSTTEPVSKIAIRRKQKQ